MTQTEVTQREYFERVIAELEKRFEEKFAAQALALQLQAGANDIRIASLNIEQSRLSADRERFLPRELWDTKLAEIDKWRDQINVSIITSASKTAGSHSVWGVIGTVVTLLIALGALIAAIIR